MTAKLITIAISHYCEKARWALDHTGLAYVEDPHAPGLHVPAVKRAGGKRPTPILLDGGRLIEDSTAILQHADRLAAPGRGLYPTEPALRAEVEALEERFDEQLGVHVRRYAYFHMLWEPQTIELFKTGVPAHERWIVPFAFPFLRRFIVKGLGIDAAAAERSRAKVDAVLDDVDRRLAGGASYLIGDRFTAADLTFASLLGPLICAEGYGGVIPPLDRYPPRLQDLVAAYRARPSAAFAARMYRDHRRAS